MIKKLPINLKLSLKVFLERVRLLCRPIICPILNRYRLKKFRSKRPIKLHIGCGKVKLVGWINIDIKPPADLMIDVVKGLPFEKSTVSFIYSEHFIEHLNYEEAKIFLKECYRILEKDGVLRIATPDLDNIVQKYSSDWWNQEWLKWPEYSWIKTKGMMLNQAFHGWEHKYLFNEEDLRNLLVEAGFTSIKRVEWGISNFVELKGLETRKDSKLIFEARK